MIVLTVTLTAMLTGTLELTGVIGWYVLPRAPAGGLLLGVCESRYWLAFAPAVQSLALTPELGRLVGWQVGWGLDSGADWRFCCGLNG